MFTLMRAPTKSSFAIAQENAEAKGTVKKKLEKEELAMSLYTYRGLDMNNEPERQLREVASMSIRYLVARSQECFSGG